MSAGYCLSNFFFVVLVARAREPRYRAEPGAMLSFVGSTCFLLAAYPSLSAAEPKVTQRVFMDLTIDGEAAGRMVIGMFGNAVPKTVSNFVGLATGNTTRNGAPLTFQGTKFHRIIPGFMAQGGDAGDS